MSKLGDKLVYSDASIEAVGSIISLVDNGSLKNNMIGIVAQKSSVKNGASNINDSKSLKDGRSLMYTDFDTNFFGIQLDAGHASDGSVVNEISQVISALAENQATPHLYSELYDAIGTIIESEITNYNKKFKTTLGDFDRVKLSKDFVEVLKKKEQTGNAVEIISLLESISKEAIPIPVSNHNFFGGFVINTISRLKTDFIKRKYPGLAAVLNPSYGMVQVYEDGEGNTHFHDDLLESADESDYGDSLENIQEKLDDQNTPDQIKKDLKEQIKNFNNPSFNNKKAIQNVINKKFPNILLKPEQYGMIKPLDFVRITDLEDNIKEYDLNDITEYYKVKNLVLNSEGIKVEIIKDRPRDLKPVEISFTQNGTDKNIFDNDPIRLTWVYNTLLSEGINSIANSDLELLQAFADLFAAKSKKNLFKITDKSQKEFILSKLSLWNKRSFDLLATGNNFVKATVENISILFSNDDFTSKLPTTYTGLIEPITNYIHKPAEIIMPKVYRSMFNIGHDSFSKIESQKEAYFINQLNGVIDPEITDVDLFIASTKGEHTYISAMTDEQIEEKGLIEKEIIVKEIDGESWRVSFKGEKIYKMPE